MKAPALALITFYQRAISPFLTPNCRYLPTCSEYSRDAIHKHGLIKGSGLSVRRLARCRPFGGRGYDPVP